MPQFIYNYLLSNSSFHLPSGKRSRPHGTKPYLEPKYHVTKQKHGGWVMFTVIDENGKTDTESASE